MQSRTHQFERERFSRARAEANAALAIRYADEADRAQRLTCALAHGESAWCAALLALRAAVAALGLPRGQLPRQA